MSQNQRGERLFPEPARRSCPTPLLRTQIGREDYAAQTEKLAFSKTVFPSRLRSPEPGFFSLFIRFYLHLCSFFCLFVSTGIGKKGERKSLRFLHRQSKGRKKKKRHETHKAWFRRGTLSRSKPVRRPCSSSHQIQGSPEPSPPKNLFQMTSPACHSASRLKECFYASRVKFGHEKKDNQQSAAQNGSQIIFYLFLKATLTLKRKAWIVAS